MRQLIYFLFIALLLVFANSPKAYAQITGEITSRLSEDEQRREKALKAFENARTEKQQNEAAAALRYYLSALYDFEVLGDSLKMAETNEETGRLFFTNELYEKAIAYFVKAELLWLKLGLITEHADLLLDLGKAYYEQNDFQKSLVYFQRVSSQAQPPDPMILNSYQGQLQCYIQMLEFDQALATNKQILDLLTEASPTDQRIAAFNNMGYILKKQNQWDEALVWFEQVEQLEIEHYGNIQPHTRINKAIVYQNLDQNSNALKELNEAASGSEETKKDSSAAGYSHLTALVYFNMKDYYNAQVYNRQTFEQLSKSKSGRLLSDSWLLSSKIYEALYDYERAGRSFQKHLTIKDSLDRIQFYNQKELTETEFLAERISQETERLWASQEITTLNLKRLKLDSANRKQEIELLHKTDSLQKSTIQNQQLENQQALQKLLLKEEQVYAAKKAKEVDSLRQIEKIQSLELETQALVQKEQENKITLLDKENEIAELNLKKVKTRNKYLFAFALLALAILYLVYRGLRYAKKTNKILVKQNNEIERQKDEIEKQRQRSDKLLLNILPEETAEELKEKGHATPRHYEHVSVLFTDFKGFTMVAERLSPQELVAELNICFLEFDKIIDKHGLEKIKTIGDAYMCAGGIPVANTTNPVDIVKAGLEIRDYMKAMKEERESLGEVYWELRIGIHTGSVVAGVVGKNKFAYDIWGDAVNTASRMESSGIPGIVNISGTTYELVKDKFNCSHRGKIKAKNKGEIDMYIVEELRAES